MSRIEDIWTPRVGAGAALLLKKQRRYAALTLVVPPIGVIGAVLAAAFHSQTAVGVLVCAGLVALAVLYVLRMRAIWGAERRAVAFCRLPVEARRWVPVLDPQRFDEWLDFRGDPRWPRHRR